MKKFVTLTLATVAMFTTVAQSINWESLKPEQRHIVHANVGWDYAATYALGYSYVVRTKLPGAITAQFSAPAGKTLWDDFKSELTYQARVLNVNGFVTTVSATANFRRYESSYLRTNSFGSKFMVIAGYYRPKWFAAGEFGFDKAIATHIANGKSYLQNYSAAVDGWYVPTGGNYNFGIRGGFSFKKMDAFLKFGKTVDQGFNTTALLPYYFQLGVNKRF